MSWTAALLAMLLPAVAGAQMLQREADLVVQTPGARQPLTAASVEVLENGQPREILTVDRVASPWRIVVWFDLPSSTPAGIEGAAAAVADAADALVSLGTVEILTADRIAEVALAPTTNAGEVRSAARTLGARAGAAGELLDLRRGLQSMARDRGGRGSGDGLRTADLLEGVLQELDTLRWQRETLLEELTAPSRSGEAPCLLLLVRDAADLSADAFAARLLGEPTATFERAARDEQRRQRSLGRTVAALGWRVHTLHYAPSDAEADALLPGRLQAAQDLAGAGGGGALADAGSLADAIDGLGTSWNIRYRSGGPRDGSVHPVDVRIARAAGAAGPPEIRARRWGTVAAPADLVALRASRALEALHSGDEDSPAVGSSLLDVRGSLLPQSIQSTAAGAAAELVILDGIAAVSADVPPSSRDLRMSVYGQGLDAPTFHLLRPGAGESTSNGVWRFRTIFDLPTAIDELVLLVEDLRSDRWRAAFLEMTSEPLDDRSDVELLLPDTDPAGAPTAARTEGDVIAAARDRARLAGWDPDGGVPRDDSTGFGVTLVRLIPPRGERSGLTGTKSFTTVTTSDAVRRVAFYLDGERVADDRRKPFQAKLDLGPEPVPHTIRIIAYDRSNRRLSEDQLTVNQARRRAGVGIASVEQQAGGRFAVEARVELAGGRVLDRVEFWRNDRLTATLTRPPFRTVLPGPAMAGADFARIAVWLDDGTMVEDVRFLSSDTPVADTTINLVEVYVVVNDERGQPVTTFEVDDFVLRSRQREIPVERFAVAEDVPLVLGLAVDSSTSMTALMQDTRRAAASFLGNTLTSIDQAFLVDFDTRPRLLADITGDVSELVGSLPRMQADGQTALYDAIQFGLVHLSRDQGRRALVVLTDGDDYGSQSGYRRTFRTAGNTGVPVYVISMRQGDPRPWDRGGPRKLDMEAIATASGGRVYYVASMAAVFEAYEHIGEELRSQYMLGYSTDAPLTPREVQSLQVELKQKAPEFELRMTVGRGRG